MRIYPSQAWSLEVLEPSWQVLCGSIPGSQRAVFSLSITWEGQGRFWMPLEPLMGALFHLWGLCSHKKNSPSSVALGVKVSVFGLRRDTTFQSVSVKSEIKGNERTEWTFKISFKSNHMVHCLLPELISGRVGGICVWPNAVSSPLWKGKRVAALPFGKQAIVSGYLLISFNFTFA